MITRRGFEAGVIEPIDGDFERFDVRLIKPFLFGK